MNAQTDTKNGKGYWTTAGVYYRTRKGSKAHASSSCANQRRSIFTGDILVISAGELKDWSGCKHCCDATELAAIAAAAPAEVKPALCPNWGVTHSIRIYSNCRNCGKHGKVISGGKLKAHAPLVK